MENHPTKQSSYAWLGRICLMAGTIVVAMVLTCPWCVFLSPFTALLFPTGLIYSIQVIFGYITGQKGWPPTVINGNGPIFFGWLIYLGISVSAILTKKRMTFIVVYTILIVLLVANLAGCQRMIAMSGSM